MKPPHTRRPGPPGGGKTPDRPPQRSPAPDRAGAGPRPAQPQRAATAQRAGGQDRSQWQDRPPRPEREEQRPPHNGAFGNRREADRPRTERPPSEKPQPGRLHAPKPPADRPRAADSAPRHGPDAPKGTVWLYGVHAIAAALANPARRLRRLLLTEEAEAAIASRLPPPWSLAVERTDRARLDHLLGRDTVHQGAALLADPLAPPVLAQVLERPGPVIVLDQVSDPRNVGAILRSAAAFGAAVVITQDRNAPEETGALAKAASGALETVPLLRAVNIARTLIALKAAGCWVVGLDSAGGALSGPALAERRVALVLGSEGEGMRRLTRDTCDEIAGIGMAGAGRGLDSLNVAAAAAVALYELGRQS